MDPELIAAFTNSVNAGFDAVLSKCIVMGPKLTCSLEHFEALRRVTVQSIEILIEGMSSIRDLCVTVEEELRARLTHAIEGAVVANKDAIACYEERLSHR